MKFPVLTDKYSWSTVRQGSVVVEPLVKDEDVHVTKDTSYEDNLRNKFTEDVDQITEISINNNNDNDNDNDSNDNNYKINDNYYKTTRTTVKTTTTTIGVATQQLFYICHVFDVYMLSY